MKNTLEFLLSSKGMSKAELASDIGVSRQTINNIVKGKTPSMEVGMKIASYFGKEVSDIFFTQDVKQVARRSKKKSA